MLRARLLEEKEWLSRALQDNLWPLLEAGKVKPVIDRAFPLEKAAEAYCRMESSEHVGKILLAVKPGIE